MAGCDWSKSVSQMDGYILKAGFMCAQFFGTIPEQLFEHVEVKTLVWEDCLNWRRLFCSRTAWNHQPLRFWNVLASAPKHSRCLISIGTLYSRLTFYSEQLQFSRFSRCYSQVLISICTLTWQCRSIVVHNTVLSALAEADPRHRLGQDTRNNQVPKIKIMESPNGLKFGNLLLNLFII